uniref:NAD(P)H-quinone oxidoreductase subunit 2, chloroplastic n=1 Tax=Netrium digitus TaxID=43946 RepID=A0A191T500_9VIRI|nr:subunit 2 of NADH-plastoquinone oxidoreductase [Netrium digitus]ANI25478.1 subunit 2 of NADH-plastoquinone oxidoreductase [Netrium digitus]
MVNNELSWLQNIITILPESILLLSLVVILIVDLILKESAWLSRIALVSLLGATIVLCWQWNQPTVTSFLGSFHVDKFSIAFRCLITLSSALCISLSTEYIQRTGMSLSEFLTFLLTASIGGMFVCGANDLIILFVSLETLSLSSYLLAGYSKKDIRSNEAAMKYLLMGGASSSILAYGFSWLYGLSGGNIQLPKLLQEMTGDIFYSSPIWIAFICVLVGISFKLSAVPFHQWTPDVYEGSPTPVVAFLSVGSKAAGLALITRIITIVFPSLQIGWQPILEVLAILSMIFGNVIAATQTSMKRMLAYSSISQIGYLIIGIVANTSDGYASMITYMLIYTFMNLGAFACVIIFGLRTGTDQIRDYTGLYFKDPWLVFCLSICLLSLAGMPPLAGFFGKIYLFWAGWASGLYILVYVGLATSVISLYYYLRVLKTMITKEAKEMSSYVSSYISPPMFVLPISSIEIGIACCVVASTIIGLFMNPIINVAQQTILVSSMMAI